MGSKKVLDLVKATGDEAIDATLSTLLPEIVKTYGETIVSEAVATIAGELVGAIFPRFNNVRLSYKQNRLERNVSIMLQQLVENDQMLSARISALEETENGRHFLKQSSEMLLDNIVDEIQPDKVKCNVSGYTNLLKTEDANIDMALMFFKTLAQLTEVDIRVLQNYDWRRSEMVELITPFNSDFDYDQLRHVKEKLVRLGLLRSNNQELSDKNQEAIIEYLQKAYKDANSRKPKGVKIPKFKKLSTTDRYKITSLGFGFLQLISDDCDMRDLSVPDDVDLGQDCEEDDE